MSNTIDTRTSGQIISAAAFGIALGFNPLYGVAIRLAADLCPPIKDGINVAGQVVADEIDTSVGQLQAVGHAVADAIIAVDDTLDNAAAKLRAWWQGPNHQFDLGV